MGCPFGTVKTKDNDFYHLRIDKYDELNRSNIVIDYSMPNIANIASSNLYEKFAKKCVYIAPVIYSPFHFDKQNREDEILTTFINTNEPRRRKLLDNIAKSGLPHKNVNNCFDPQELKNLYCNTKIIINIHQTDHHHSFEELRVLPALTCGVLVVCEESPLSHLIPYNDYIIWSSYDKIIEKASEVANNYNYYYDKIFGQRDNNEFFTELHNKNIESLQDKITQGKL